MFALKFTLFVLLSFLGFAAFAEAVLPPESVEQAIGFLPILIEAFKNSNWLAFGAGVSLILTFIAKQYVLPKLNLGNGLLPLVSAGVGVIAGVGGAVLAGSTVEAALLAVLSGPLASTIWDAVAKYFFAKST